ncbi:MAG TPA: hypothetical protein PLG48_06875, partial [Candidatus Avimonas sp.]|nr:hypothetical protein [Candidatus Avimonas sp.]
MKLLGFDFNWNSCIGANVLLDPCFEVEVLETFDDGSRIIRDSLGLIVKERPGVTSIPAEIGTTLKGRYEWENLYLPKLQMSQNRVDFDLIKNLPSPEERQIPIGLHLGSLIGHMRNLLGVEQLSYLYADDEELFAEIVDTLCG